MRQLIDKLMQRLGYVRLTEYGYTLTPDGRIVEVPKVIDDRFEPPPLALPTYGSEATPAPMKLLPSPAPVAQPAPRPSAPLAVGTEPTPLFTVSSDGEPLGAEPPQSVGTAEDSSPAPASTETSDGRTEVDEVDADEWEWKMALARARAVAESSESEAPDLQAEALEAEELEAEELTEVPDQPVSPAPPRLAPVRATGSRPVPTRTMPLPSNRVRPAPRPSQPPSRKRSLTGIDLGSDKSQLPGTRRANDSSARTPMRKDIERAASRVVTPAAPHIRRRGPNGRLARGTEPLAAGKPSSLSTVRSRSSLDVGDTTATDITALDRARQSMKPDEDTCVTLAVAPNDGTVDESIDERTSVELEHEQAPQAALPPMGEAAPLPRLSARLRRAHQ